MNIYKELKLDIDLNLMHDIIFVLFCFCVRKTTQICATRLFQKCMMHARSLTNHAVKNK